MRQEDTVRMGEAYEPLSRFRVASASGLDVALTLMKIRNPEVFSISSAGGGNRTCEFVVNDSRFAEIGVIGAGVLEKYLAAALGMVPRGRLTLDPALDLSMGPGAALARLMNFILTELDRPDAILGNPGAAAGLQDVIAGVVLKEHPHSHSHYFQSTAKTAVPAVVRRSEEYLESQATEAVSMADLPQIAGVGVRAIQATFRRYRGYSPQEFLKTVRLKEANDRLMSGKAARVIDVAYDCGFAKLSSFSADYARRFGELPSVTLRRTRGGRTASSSG